MKNTQRNGIEKEGDMFVCGVSIHICQELNCNERLMRVGKRGLKKGDMFICGISI